MSNHDHGWALANGLIISTLALALMTSTALAVTVNIEVTDMGEPVPGTEISFETIDGEPIDLSMLLEEEPPSDASSMADAKPEPMKDDPKEPLKDDMAESGTMTDPPMDKTAKNMANSDSAMKEGSEMANADNPDVSDGQDFTLDDGLIGQQIRVLVRKDGKLIKTQQLALDQSSSKLAIAAYDPKDAMISANISQPKPCKAGKACDFLVSVSNRGEGIYEGPVFWRGSLPAEVGKALTATGAWYCAALRRGKTLCHMSQSLQPGEQKDFAITASLRQSHASNVCLKTENAVQDGPGRANPLVSVLQLGLARAGHSAGRPDGLAGPKTAKAIANYAQEANLEGEPDQATLFDSLYGYPLQDYARLPDAKGSNCIKLALIAPPRKVIKKTTRSSTSKPRRTTKKAVPKRVLKKPSVSFSLSIGIGGRSKKKHHRRTEPSEHY